MGEHQSNINWTSFLLAWVAGFCDTTTFISGDNIFSAHVTGNFIVLAAQLVSGSHNASDWIKLITFPVFVAAVILGGWIAAVTRRYNILVIESLLLIVAGIGAVFMPALSVPVQHVLLYFLVFIVVTAMGLQNTFGKVYPKETYGPTTMMTGNVTQAALDLGNLLRKGAHAEGDPLQSLKRIGIPIGGFFLGCLFGGILARYLGLTAIICPGVAIIICYLLGESFQSKSIT
jgi:uncharacterized membrane protein YoaK (UPF0700 family)